MPPNHEAAIEHIDNQLAMHGIVSFAEVNKKAYPKSAGGVLNRKRIAKQSGKTAQHASKLLELGHLVLSLPRTTTKGTKSRSTQSPRTGFSYYIVRADLEPFVKHAQASGSSGSGAYHPLVNALLRIDEKKSEDNHILLSSLSKGTRELVQRGLLEKVRFSPRERPKGIGAHFGKFRITDPELIERAIKAVRQAIYLQEGVF